MSTNGKAIGSRSYETQLLADRLKKLRPDEVVSYDELSKIAGDDVRPFGKAYGKLWSARRIVENEAGFLVGVVEGEGIKRLNVNEQAALAPHHLKKTRRMNRRELRRMARVEYSKLTPQQQQQHNVAASVMGVVEMFTRPKSVERLAGAVQQSAAKLPIGDTLRLFNADGA